MTNLETLRTIGQSLYGPQWQAPLARDLAVNVRTMRRWIAGDSAIPADALDKLRNCVRERQHTLKRVLADTAR